MSKKVKGIKLDLFEFNGSSNDEALPSAPDPNRDPNDRGRGGRGGGRGGGDRFGGDRGDRGDRGGGGGFGGPRNNSFG